MVITAEGVGLASPSETVANGGKGVTQVRLVYRKVQSGGAVAAVGS